MRVTVAVSKNDLKHYDPDQKIWYPADDVAFFVGQNCEDVTAVKL